MNASEVNTENIALVSWTWIRESNDSDLHATSSSLSAPKTRSSIDWFKPIRNWLDNVDVKNAEFARSICQMIPAQCPFERDVTVFGRTLFHIPPMCKLNPVYEQVVALRFRALCYLADVCGEDVSPYC